LLDVRVFLRLAAGKSEPLEDLVIPGAALTFNRLCIGEKPAVPLAGYRYETLQPFFQLACSASLVEISTNHRTLVD
jgi:hypothetical protein